MRSLRTTVMVGLVGLAAVVTVGLSVAVYAYARNLAEEALLDELRLRAETVGGNVEIEESGPVLEVPLPMTPEYVRKQSGVYFVVWDRQGRVIFRSPSLNAEETPAAPPWTPHRLEYGEIERGPFGTRCATLHMSIVARTEEDFRGWVATAPLEERPDDALLDAEAVDRRFHVLIAIETRRRDEPLAALATFLTIAGLGAVGLSVVLAFLVSARLLAPLRRMTEEAAGITLDTTRRLGEDAVVPELESLANTLNSALDRLRDALERQSRLTADASHELRTPLAVLQGNAEFLLRRDRTGEEYRSGLAIQLRAAERMAALSESLLTLARADSGTAVIERAPVDLAETARSAVESWRPAARAKSLELGLTAPSGVVVSGDSGRLEQVAENLVSNAVKFTPPGGSVSVSVTLEGSDAVLTVSDSGPGIPEALRDRLFERFFRVDGSRSETDGFGLGLSIVQWIVKAHGGTIAAACPASGGSVFSVRLPAS